MRCLYGLDLWATMTVRSFCEYAFRPVGLCAHCVPMCASSNRRCRESCGRNAAAVFRNTMSDAMRRCTFSVNGGASELSATSLESKY